ncbi:MAG: hypothetical protein J2P15_03260 [Micromonosporaceae bacterium]|nr:hypothetical protein [Micromonosporaceae bacterium]
MLPPTDLVQPEWHAESLRHNPLNGATGGIWRVDRGPAGSAAGTAGRRPPFELAVDWYRNGLAA